MAYMLLWSLVFIVVVVVVMLLLWLWLVLHCCCGWFYIVVVVVGVVVIFRLDNAFSHFLGLWFAVSVLVWFLGENMV